MARPSGLPGIAALALALAVGLGAARAAAPLPFAGPGPLAVTVLRVIDGDTLVVRLPDGTAERVRLRGIDTPELRGHCPGERAAALAARATAALLVQSARRVELVEIAPRREVWGRVLARVLVDGLPLDGLLLAGGHGVPYAGGHRGDWCAVPTPPAD